MNFKTMFHHYWKLISVLVVGMVFGYFGSIGIDTPGLKPRIQFDTSGNYRFTNRLLDCEVDGEKPELLRPFEHKVAEFIDNRKAKTLNIKSVSVYFRDLKNGIWVGINEKSDFSPASMLKVPLMITYLKAAESDPRLLKKTISVDPGTYPPIMTQGVAPSLTVQNGKIYTIEDLMEYMIFYSDNKAQVLLYQNMDEKVLNNIYMDLGITVPGVKGLEDFMDVIDYASFFRILYNATYLNRDSSEKALSYLTKTEYKDGLRKHIPLQVPIAHKFGERELLQAGEVVTQIHDCGIVYYPNSPYILCIMTRGRSIDEQAELVADLSKFVFDEVKEGRGN